MSAMTWKRDPDGTGWYSADGSAVLERGAKCEGTNTDCWMVWFRLHDEHVGQEDGFRYPKVNGENMSPLRRLSSDWLMPAAAAKIGDAWYYHRNDAGSLSEAKHTAQVVLEMCVGL